MRRFNGPGRSTLLPLMVTALASSPSLAAETMDEVVVTATRTKTSTDQVGSSITVITAEQIEAKQATKVEDVLRDVPGVSVTRQGGLGSTSQVRTRGTEPNHTLVLLDGQRINYQDTIYNFDFDWLQTDDIERIEVLRGPAAGQWGSDAVGGVINIITKKGKGPMKVTAIGELGSFSTNKESVSAKGGGERYDYDFGWSRYRTAGWSTASKERGYGSEKDGSQNNTYHAKVGLSPTDNSDIEARVSHTDMFSELDTSSSGITRDATRAKHKHVDSGSLKGSLALLDGFWNQTATFSAIHNDQWLDGDYTAKGDLYRAYDGLSWNAGWQNDLRFNKDNTTTFGVEHSTDRYRQISYDQNGKVVSTAMSTDASYIQHQTRLFDVLDLTGGWRGNQHDTFGWKPTYFGSAAYHLPTGTTLKGSYGTSFKAPLLYQIYYPSGLSNPALLPEEGRSWDVGIEQRLLDGKAKTGVTWFRNDINNMINLTGTAPNQQYKNTAKATTYGFETFFNYTVFSDADGSLTLSPHYTYTQAYDRATGEELARRPRHMAGGNINWRFLEKRAMVNLAVTSQSDFQENRSTNSRVPGRMGAYEQFDLSASYDLTDNLQIFGRVDNMFDRYHESAYGYAETGGRAFYLGMKVSFEPVKMMTGAEK
jgi:vitamin B12 transporter